MLLCITFKNSERIDYTFITKDIYCYFILIFKRFYILKLNRKFNSFPINFFRLNSEFLINPFIVFLNRIKCSCYTPFKALIILILHVYNSFLLCNDCHDWLFLLYLATIDSPVTGRGRDVHHFRAARLVLRDGHPTISICPSRGNHLDKVVCQKRQKNEGLSPTSDSLRLHIMRANYQTMIWKLCLMAMHELPSPIGNEWTSSHDLIKLVLMTKEAAPQSLAELMVCKCDKSSCRSNSHCTCRVNNMPHTEACRCMGEESCQNPNTFEIVDDSDDDEE